MRMLKPGPAKPKIHWVSPADVGNALPWESHGCRLCMEIWEEKMR